MANTSQADPSVHPNPSVPWPQAENFTSNESSAALLLLALRPLSEHHCSEPTGKESAQGPRLALFGVRSLDGGA